MRFDRSVVNQATIVIPPRFFVQPRGENMNKPATNEEPLQYICPVCNVGYRLSDLDLNMRGSRKPKCPRLHRLRAIRHPIGAAVVALISSLFMILPVAFFYPIVRDMGRDAPFMFAIPLIFVLPFLMGGIFQLGTWLLYRRSEEPANRLACPGLTSGITLLGVAILTLAGYVIALQQASVFPL